MHVSDIIRVKGSDVVTLPPTATVTELVQVLVEKRIGAVVVSEGDGIQGIVGERDVVRFLHAQGDLSSPVSVIMTADVTMCTSDAELQDIAQMMTEQRIRHMPVVDDGVMVALVSIGDVVKARLDSLEDEREQLENYLHS